MVKLTSNESRSIVFDIYDELGRKVLTDEVDVNPGVTNHELNLRSAPGRYLIMKIQSGTKVKTLKLIR